MLQYHCEPTKRCSAQLVYPLKHDFGLSFWWFDLPSGLVPRAFLTKAAL